MIVGFFAPGWAEPTKILLRRLHTPPSCFNFLADFASSSFLTSWTFYSIARGYLFYWTYQGKSGLFDLSLVSTLVLAGFRCGLMGLSGFLVELMARRDWVVPVRHSGHLVAFLLSL